VTYRLRQSALEAIVAHARRETPRECCGVLIGRADEILEAAPARNLADGNDRFVLDPRDHIDIRRRARHAGLDVVGFYHSHPHSSPRPSAVDLAEASYPDHCYLIVALGGADAVVALYRMTDGNFVEAPFVTVT
jgi:proteasome lid subunit RPN8/RPN11